MKFSKGDEEIFSTSLCYHCGNYFIRYPDGGGDAEWVDFRGEKLEAFLKKVMPIPQAEIDRFNAKHGSKKEQAEDKK